MYKIHELTSTHSGLQTLSARQKVGDFPIALVNYAISTGHYLYRWQRGNLELYRPKGDAVTRQTWYINGLQRLQLSDLPIDVVPSDTSRVPPFRAGMPTC